MRVKFTKSDQTRFASKHCSGDMLKTNCLLCGSYYQPSPTIKSKNNLFCYLMVNICWMDKCHPELDTWMRDGGGVQPNFNSIACASSVFKSLNETHGFDERRDHLNCIYEHPDMSFLDINDLQDVIENGQDIPIVSYEIEGLDGDFEKNDDEACKRKASLPKCSIEYTSEYPVTTPIYNTTTAPSVEARLATEKPWIENGNVGGRMILVLLATIAGILVLLVALWIGRKIYTRRRLQESMIEISTKEEEEEALST